MKKFLLMLLSLLGFSFVVTSCYGAPYAELTAEGRVTDETGKPLQGIKVSLHGREYIPYTVTDEDGRFKLEDNTGYDTVNIFYEDTDGILNGGEFAPDSTMKLKAVQIESGSGRWDLGKFEATDQKVLKKKQ